ncbi:tRNA(Ile)-lysidine synthase [Poseidonocella pacifica]|uniref:tRNA(Ile)-lysidine synthase n=1 Tax=Poseidonocella pacifica TaxID=871651 RepID=A0A1I0WMA6_9RHOB|nr:tRNA lysidine(34) synthetase TilS [Poseidonocella pacifica]SFA89338.1 tRNA(Ile)-lysidine synthase [Poseidonocella pacifica]
MTEAPERAFTRAMEAEFPVAPQRLALAVSGGGDSMALMALAQDWAKQSGTQLEVLTVDHRLRTGAALEIALVERFCQAAQIPHRTLVWTGWDHRGNLQDQARRARYTLLSGAAQGCDAILLGHTKDDLAETFLMRLARGAGSDGLRAMRASFERDGTRFLRPLLSVSRESLRQLLRTRGIDWIDDPSNDDPRFERVRARKALAAMTELGFGADGIAISAHHLAAENAALRREAFTVLTNTVEQVCGAFRIALTALADLEPELRRRAVLAMVRSLGAEEYPPRGDALAEFIAALVRGETRTLAGCLSYRHRDWCWLQREPAYLGPSVSAGDIWDNRWRFAQVEGARTRELGEDGLAQCGDWRSVGLPRRVLLVSPALFKGETLHAAPFAGLSGDVALEYRGKPVQSFLMPH